MPFGTWRTTRNIYLTMTALVVVGAPAHVQGRPRARQVRVAVPTPDVRATLGPALVYGRTTSGCIMGAVALPSHGEGFVRRFPQRNTEFGHPDLVAYVRRLGQAVHRAGLGSLQIGDMSLRHGGAFARGHASHQTGLDVDIAFRTFGGKGWLKAPNRTMTMRSSLTSSMDGRRSSCALVPGVSGRIAPVDRADRTSADQPDHDSADGPRPERPAPAASAPSMQVETLLRLAAADERVDRIFVAAKIKLRLCRTVTSDRGFLRVLRPWQGHEHHFHVRLKCPESSPDCRPNEPVTSIPDDCEALARWWRAPNVPAAFAEWRASERVAHMRDLPDVCRALQTPETFVPRWYTLAPGRTPAQ
jgi:penicillin-insensitive murein endopeptidase